MPSKHSYRTETTKLSAQVINSNWVRKIQNGHDKQAADEGSAFIRQILRQESYAREIIEPILLQDDELDRDVDSDQPRKIVEKEPNSTAFYVPFDGSAKQVFFKGPRYEVKMFKIEGQRNKKSKFELMTYLNDIRKILSDNAVKDMAEVEDARFIRTVNVVLAAFPGQVLNAAAFDGSAFSRAFGLHVDRAQPIGKMLMAKSLYYESLTLPATQIGNDVASRHYDQGIEAEEKLFGIPVVTTIRANQLKPLPNKRSAYIFNPQEWLGNFYLLQNATLFIKQEADQVEFWTYESIGLGIGNTNAITRIDFPAP
jgi:hypothetical protein